MNRRARLWVSALAYGALTLVPLFVVHLGSIPRERGFWIEFGVALGFVGLAMLGLQSILTARFPRISGSLGQDALLQFHRQAGLVAFGLILAHPVILLASNSAYWAFLDPTKGFLRAFFLWIVLAALPTIIVTALWRDRLKLPYEWWRLGHGALAMLIVLIGLVHITRVAYYLESGWKQALWVGIGAASIGSVLYVRALKPLRIRRHPHRVDEVEEIADGTWELSLSAESGRTVRFRAGQFGFLTIAATPFDLEQHPFSFASSARDTAGVRFAIKELGDFTAGIGDVEVGSRAWVDGPYGSMGLHDQRPPGVGLVAGGIGITPIISVLRTLRDEGATHPVVVIYANQRTTDIAYRRELDDLASQLDLTVVHVLADPDASWDGERGLVDAALLDRHLPADRRARWRYLVCGPPPMMEAAETALTDLGIPLDHIESERFDLGAAASVGRRAVGIRRMVVGLSAVVVAGAALWAAV
ncbi:ferredoxin reductase family protein [Rhabdothermincola salaria]|uniref:ferredoxin reductase family protein n=1 Tax=Rhabdothermincola salaria TaxID=2903142 RepID=UPI001E321AF3|nr:ferric reductase-like transmembrane domain-containing protein [Rhabdothermincola salaria]MCD9624340.1 ferric reductase-like transmembrane domain-containing protein [Rhabdothermincola salaria]